MASSKISVRCRRINLGHATSIAERLDAASIDLFDPSQLAPAGSAMRAVAGDRRQFAWNLAAFLCSLFNKVRAIPTKSL
jgi:hypothetical protein